MADASASLPQHGTPDEPLVLIALDRRAFADPTLDEARLVHAWLEAELEQIFGDTS